MIWETQRYNNNCLSNKQIADFGLSRILEDEITRTTNSTIGALKWYINIVLSKFIRMAPESLSKREYSEKYVLKFNSSFPRSDVWMYGCTCYEIIYKKHPYPGVAMVDAAGNFNLESSHC